MSGTPLTKLLHNGSVQVGTGVSGMGSRRGTIGFTAVRSLLWPLGLAVGTGAFFATLRGVIWPLSHQSGQVIKSFNQGIRAALVAIACDGVCRVLFSCARFVFRSLLRCMLLDTSSSLVKLVASGWRQFELLLGKASTAEGMQWTKPSWAPAEAPI